MDQHSMTLEEAELIVAFYRREYPGGIGTFSKTVSIPFLLAQMTIKRHEIEKKQQLYVHQSMLYLTRLLF
jgi:hypothetical protein